MIWTILIVAPLLIGVYVACYRAHPLASAVMIISFYIATVCVGVFSSWLALIFLAIIPLFVLCRWLGVSRPAFAGASAVLVVILIGISVVAFVPRWRELQALDDDYPRERINKRLAYESRQISSNPIADNGTDVIESEDFQLLSEYLDGGRFFRMESKYSPWHYDWREASLRKLEQTHESFAQAFAAQDGFGAVRRIRIPATDEYIRLPGLEPLTLSDLPRSSVSATATESHGEFVTATDDTRSWHAMSVANFANTPGFGMIINPNSNNAIPDDEPGAIWTRGFESHGFQSVPEESPIGDEWQIASLDLVSLLKHDPPAVYISDPLPRMEELSSDDFPTRELDDFETRALKKLQEGETIVVQSGRNRVRMLGALLAAKQCIQCHNVSQGEMLGAFTYEFLRKEPLPPKKVKERTAPPLT